MKYSRREYFVAALLVPPQAVGRTAGSLLHRTPNKKEPEGSFLFGTPAGNRTRNGPLGGGCYIHLTTEADLFGRGGARHPAARSDARAARADPVFILHLFPGKGNRFSGTSFIMREGCLLAAYAVFCSRPISTAYISYNE